MLNITEASDEEECKGKILEMQRPLNASRESNYGTDGSVRKQIKTLMISDEDDNSSQTGSMTKIVT